MRQGVKEAFGRKMLILAVMAVLLLGALAGCGQREEPAAVRVGGLKGPTSMGLVFAGTGSERTGGAGVRVYHGCGGG